jgi:hypothetical protein
VDTDVPSAIANLINNIRNGDFEIEEEEEPT